MRVICHVSDDKIKDKKSSRSSINTFALAFVVVVAYMALVIADIFNATGITLLVMIVYVFIVMMLSRDRGSKDSSDVINPNIKIFKSLIRSYKHVSVKTDFEDDIVILKFKGENNKVIKRRLRYDELEFRNEITIPELHIYNNKTVLMINSNSGDLNYSDNMFELVQLKGNQYLPVES